MKDSCCCQNTSLVAELTSPVNRPGLPALQYRIGTHKRFLSALLHRLGGPRSAELAVPGGEIEYLLAGLKSRDVSDPAVALLDAWSVAADILTFYQERIANEGYLRTATERRSLLELSRLVGYHPRPGISASVFLSFQTEGKDLIVIPEGTRVQSIPESGGRAQTFETSAELEARTAWNGISPRLGLPLLINEDNVNSVTTLYVKGNVSGLKAGDPLVLAVASEDDVKEAIQTKKAVKRTGVPRWVLEVIPEPQHNRTQIKLFTTADSAQEFLTSLRTAIADITQVVQSPAAIDLPLPKNVTVAKDLVNSFNSPEFTTKGIAEQDKLAVEKLKHFDDIDEKLSDNLKAYQTLSAFPANIETTAESSVDPNGIAPKFVPVSDFVKDFKKLTSLYKTFVSEYGKLPDSTTLTNPLSTAEKASILTVLKLVRAQFDSGGDFEAYGNVFKAPLTTMINALEAAGGISQNAYKDAKETLIRTTAGQTGAAGAEPAALLVAHLGGIEGALPTDPVAIATSLDSFIEADYSTIPLKLTTSSLSKFNKARTENFKERRKIANDALDAKFKSGGGLKTDYDTAVKAVPATNEDLTGWLNGVLNTYSAPPAPGEKLAPRIQAVLKTRDAAKSLTNDQAKIHAEIQVIVSLLDGLEQAKPADIKNGKYNDAIWARRQKYVKDSAEIVDAYKPDLAAFPGIVSALKGLADALEKAVQTPDITNLPKPEFQLAEMARLTAKAKSEIQKVSVTGEADATKQQLLRALNRIVKQVQNPPIQRFEPFHAGVTDPFTALNDALGAAQGGAISDTALAQRLESMFETGGNRANEWVIRILRTFYGETSAEAISAWQQTPILDFGARIYRLRQKCPLFGYNAPIPNIKNPDQDWLLAADEGGGRLFLSDTIEEVVSGSYVAISYRELPLQYPNEKVTYSAPPDPIIKVAEVSSASIGPRTAYGISGRTTQVNTDLLGDWWGTPADIRPIRGSLVYAASEELFLVDAPLTYPIGPTAANLPDQTDADGLDRESNVSPDELIELDGFYEGLIFGKSVIIAGQRIDDSGSPIAYGAENVWIVSVEHGVRRLSSEEGEEKEVQPPNDSDYLPGDTPHTRIRFTPPLRFRYRRDTVKILANVVEATHGETQRQILGDGDAQQVFQSFPLRAAPLTYLPAVTPRGSESSLEVRVNQVRWRDVEDLSTADVDDRSYAIDSFDDGSATTVFGDGEHGQRLPTGRDNVRALYRVGLGREGNVRADRITQLVTRPPGVKSVTNPLPATGGADRDELDELRDAAPLAVSAFDRLVSVEDFGSFVRTFAGIGKAAAYWLPATPQTPPTVQITIAGQEDAAISRDSRLFRNLQTSLDQFGDVGVAVDVQPRRLRLLMIAAKLRIEADRRFEDVEPRVRAALLERFGFHNRRFGQAALPSEALAVMQAVPGVELVDLDLFSFVDEPTTGGWKEHLQEVNRRLLGQVTGLNGIAPVAVSEPTVMGDTILAAELAYLSDLPETLILLETRG